MTAEGWLTEHVGDAPPRLVETMMDALNSVEGESIPEHLTEGAFLLFRRVIEGSGGREDALPLLAADALLTHAFEAQAELNPEALDDFTRHLARAERLAALAP